MKNPFVLVMIAVIFAVLFGALIIQQYGFQNSAEESASSIDVGAKNVQFTSWELQTWNSVKDRVVVYNSDPEFPDPDNRVLGWYSMRNSSSSDYYQKSMEYLCFWEWQGENGEWEAVVSIYNSPDSTSDFVQALWSNLRSPFKSTGISFASISSRRICKCLSWCC